MSEAIVTPNAKQLFEEAYSKMMEAYDRWYHLDNNGKPFEGDYWQDYLNRLNSYRDLCTVIVGRLCRENPRVLEDMHVLYLS